MSYSLIRGFFKNLSDFEFLSSISNIDFYNKSIYMKPYFWKVLFTCCKDHLTNVTPKGLKSLGNRLKQIMSERLASCTQNSIKSFFSNQIHATIDCFLNKVELHLYRNSASSSSSSPILAPIRSGTSPPTLAPITPKVHRIAEKLGVEETVHNITEGTIAHSHEVNVDDILARAQQDISEVSFYENEGVVFQLDESLAEESEYIREVIDTANSEIQRRRNAEYGSSSDREAAREVENMTNLDKFLTAGTGYLAILDQENHVFTKNKPDNTFSVEVTHLFCVVRPFSVYLSVDNTFCVVARSIPIHPNSIKHYNIFIVNSIVKEEMHDYSYLENEYGDNFLDLD